MSIPERDWKILRRIKDEKLNQLCGNILQEVMQEIQQAGGSEQHQAYLKVFELVQKRDKEIVNSFDNITRSHALIKLRFWKNAGLLSEDDLALLSEETRAFLSS